MIQTLTIHNIALIEHVSVEFHKGFQVLSGETGAGKSIILDAVILILGGRADKDLIRVGTEKASVEATFEASACAELKKILEKEEIDWNNGNIVVYREISRAGKNICRINGVMVPVSLLKDVSVWLINLHGQSEHQLLADEASHLQYLDRMGDEKHREILDSTAEAFRNFITNHRMYAKLVKMNNGKEYRMDVLKHELEELRRLNLQSGEEERLSEESRRLQKAARIHDRIQHASDLISNSEEKMDAMHNLQSAVHELRNLNGEDPEFGKIGDRCESIYFELEDVLYHLNSLIQHYDYDPGALENAENRLESIRKLTKKYGPSVDDVLGKQQEMEEEYSNLQSLDENLAKMGREHKALLAEYRSCARMLTQSRKNIAGIFQARMMKELKDLGMQNTRIEVHFEEPEDGKPKMPSSSGDDHIVFMISANPGEPLKPMAKVASGGELSRLMLAVKTIESWQDGSPTMIFDEIDTGISGRIAQAVADKMTAISGRQQVICISHLPQVAAAADQQFLVHKETREGRTVTEVHEMTEKERIDEIAKMISGAQGISENARDYAAQMIEASVKSRPARRKEHNAQVQADL